MAIEERAKAAGVSVSAYVRAAALGRKLRRRGDLDALDVLVEADAELTRLAERLAGGEGQECVEEARRRFVGFRERMALAAGDLG